MNAKAHRTGRSRAAIMTVVLGYAAFGTLWMLLSEAAMNRLLDDPGLIAVAGVLKGLAFVAMTTLLLYVLLGNSGFSGDPFVAHPRRSLRLPLAVIGVAILSATFTAIEVRLAEHRRIEASRIQTIADTKTRQIVDWLRERRGDAQHLATDPSHAEDYASWMMHRNQVALAKLVAHLDNYRVSKPYATVSLRDHAGQNIWSSSGEAPPRDPRLLAAADGAIERRTGGQPQPYRDESGHLNLGFMAPLATKPGQPAGIVILGVDSDRELFPLLQSWPVPSARDRKSTRLNSSH